MPTRPPARFPALAPADFFWTARDTFPAWAGYRVASSSLSTPAASVGEAAVHVVYPGPGDAPVPPAPAQLAAYVYLKSHDAVIAEAVLGAVYDAYPKIRADYAPNPAAEKRVADAIANDPELRKLFKGRPAPPPQTANLAPPIRKPADLKVLIALAEVNVLAIARSGHAYVGLLFHCAWDPEHDLGVMTHRSRVLHVGAGETSFDPTHPTADGGAPIP